MVSNRKLEGARDQLSKHEIGAVCSMHMAEEKACKPKLGRMVFIGELKNLPRK